MICPPAVSVSCVINSQPVDGMGSSIAIGARALPDGLDGVFVVLGDMPAVHSEDFGRLIAAFENDPSCTVAAPMYQDQRGHPVLFRSLHTARADKIAGSDFEQPKAGPKGGGQDARSNPRRLCREGNH